MSFWQIVLHAIADRSDACTYDRLSQQQLSFLFKIGLRGWYEFFHSKTAGGEIGHDWRNCKNME